MGSNTDAYPLLKSLYYKRHKKRRFHVRKARAVLACVSIFQLVWVKPVHAQSITLAAVSRQAVNNFIQGITLSNAVNTNVQSLATGIQSVQSQNANDLAEEASSLRQAISAGDQAVSGTAQQLSQSVSLLEENVIAMSSVTAVTLGREASTRRQDFGRISNQVQNNIAARIQVSNQVQSLSGAVVAGDATLSQEIVTGTASVFAQIDPRVQIAERRAVQGDEALSRSDSRLSQSISGNAQAMESLSNAVNNQLQTMQTVQQTVHNNIAARIQVSRQVQSLSGAVVAGDATLSQEIVTGTASVFAQIDPRVQIAERRAVQGDEALSRSDSRLSQSISGNAQAMESLSNAVSNQFQVVQNQDQARHNSLSTQVVANFVRINTQSTATSSSIQQLDIDIENGDSTLQVNLEQTENAVRNAAIAGDDALARVDSTLASTITDQQGDITSVSNHVNAQLANVQMRISQNFNSLLGRITTEATARGQGDTALTNNLNSEASERRAADSTLTVTLNREQSIRESTDLTLTTNIAAEVNARTSGDATIIDAVNTERITRQNSDTSILNNLANERNSRIAGDTDARNRVTTEASQRGDADSALQNNVDAEAAARSAADTSLTTALGDETAARTAADATLQSNVDSEAATRGAADTSLTTALGDETAARTAADATLQGNVDSEVGVRSAADQALQSSVNTERAARTAAALSLGTSIASGDTNEAAVRSTADHGLQASIDAERLNRISALTSMRTSVSSGDASIAVSVNSEATTRQLAVNSLQLMVQSEENDRLSADQALASTILSSVNSIMSHAQVESAARITADQSLTTALQSSLSSASQSHAAEYNAGDALLSAALSSTESRLSIILTDTTTNLTNQLSVQNAAAENDTLAALQSTATTFASVRLQTSLMIAAETRNRTLSVTALSSRIAAGDFTLSSALSQTEARLSAVFVQATSNLTGQLSTQGATAANETQAALQSTATTFASVRLQTSAMVAAETSNRDVGIALLSAEVSGIAHNISTEILAVQSLLQGSLSRLEEQSILGDAGVQASLQRTNEDTSNNVEQSELMTTSIVSIIMAVVIAVASVLLIVRKQTKSQEPEKEERGSLGQTMTNPMFDQSILSEHHTALETEHNLDGLHLGEYLSDELDEDLTTDTSDDDIEAMAYPDRHTDGKKTSKMKKLLNFHKLISSDNLNNVAMGDDSGKRQALTNPGYVDDIESGSEDHFVLPESQYQRLSRGPDGEMIVEDPESVGESADTQIESTKVASAAQVNVKPLQALAQVDDDNNFTLYQEFGMSGSVAEVKFTGKPTVSADVRATDDSLDVRPDEGLSNVSDMVAIIGSINSMHQNGHSGDDSVDGFGSEFSEEDVIMQYGEVVKTSNIKVSNLFGGAGVFKEDNDDEKKYSSDE